MPKMEAGTVEMVPVDWIMQHATDSVDGYGTPFTAKPSVNYQSMIRAKATDDHFGDIVGAILNQGFRVPIVLCLDGDGIVHGNGHHRMAAAILLALSEIPVYWSESRDEYMCEEHSDSEDLKEYPEWDDLSEEVYTMFWLD